MKPWLPLLLIPALMASSALAPVAMAAPPTGAWVFDETPDMPGFTRLVVTEQNGQYSGTVTSHWYGDLPLKDIYIDGDKLSFHLFNGNMRVPEYPITVTKDGDHIRMKGQVWDAVFDLPAHTGSDAEVKALDFPSYPLPAPRDVKATIPGVTPPMGWSSWNKFATDIDDKTVRQIADSLVSSGLRDAGYVYVNIDDGWQGQRDKDGVLQPNAKFPDMKALADYVHGRGLKLGIYTSPGPKSSLHS